MQADRGLAFELQNVLGQLKRDNKFKHNHSGLKGAERHILLLICDIKKGKAITISDIANKIGVTLAAVTHQINTLEKQGLIKRLPNSDDRRVVLIELTKKGNAQVVKLKKEFTKRIQILTDFLGEEDTKDLIRLIRKMADFGGFTKG
jgi:DNA-binding MarR family transcriptional regulator